MGVVALFSSAGIVPALETRIAHLVLTVATALVAGGIAALGAIGARALRKARPVWLGAAFALEGLFAAPLVALGPRTLSEWPGLLVTLVTADIAVALLLIAVARPPTRIGTWAAGFAAALGAVVSVLVGGLAGGLAPLLEGVGPEVLISLAWVAVGAFAIADGWRERDSATWRVGIGLLIVGLAHGHRAALGLGPVSLDLSFSALQLVGELAVCSGLVHRLRGQVITLFAETDRQRSQLHEAADHMRRATELADERDHELANGLAGLSGIAFLLDDPAARHDATALRTAVVGELSRLHGLLVTRRAEDGESADVDVHDVVAEVALLHRSRGMDIQVTVAGEVLARGNRAALSQVVTNLLVNCERHAPGSPVRIRVAQDGGRVGVLVEDDGPGVPVGAEQSVVRRGVSGSPGAGRGLGLHLSSRLMEQQHGWLRVLPRRPDRGGFSVQLQLPGAGRTEIDADDAGRIGSDDH